MYIIKGAVMFRKIVLLSLVVLGAFSAGLQAQNFQISGGSHYSVVLCANGSIFTWGFNDHYQLGRYTSGDYSTIPKEIDPSDLPPVKSVDAGSGAHAIALACDGTVWTWGNADKGQLGDGVVVAKNGTPCSAGTSPVPGNCDSPIPVQVVGVGGTGILEDVIYVTASTNSSYAITEDNKLYAWGSNEKGELGTGNRTLSFSATPVVIDLDNVIAVDAADYGCYALVDDNGDGVGTVYGWGSNVNEEYAPGGATVYEPIVIKKEDGSPLDNVTMITSGDTHGMFLDEDGYLWAVGGVWGGGNQLGNIDADYSPIKGLATKVLAGEQVQMPGYEYEPYLANVLQISAGQAHSMALVEYDGVRYMMAWGTNDFQGTGMLGTGNIVSANTPVFVKKNSTEYLTNVQGISDGDHMSYATTYDPEVDTKAQTWIWGGNKYGQIGDGTTTDKLYPTEFIEPTCKPADPCPEVNLGPEVLEVCPSQMDYNAGVGILLSAGAPRESYDYKWTYIDSDGNDLSDYLSYFYADKKHSSLYAYMPGTITVEIIDNTPAAEKVCRDCEPAIDSIKIVFQEPTFKTKVDSFCGSSAIVNMFDVTGENYELYASEVGGDPLDAGVAAAGKLSLTGATSELERVLKDPLGNDYPADSLFYKAWVEDVTRNEAKLATDVPSDCSKTDKLGMNQQGAQKFMVYSPTADFISVKVDISVWGNDAQSLTPVILPQTSNNGNYVADWKAAPIFTGDPFEFTAAGEYEIPINATLEGNITRGRVYWLGFISSDQSFQLKNFKCVNYPYTDKSGMIEIVDASKGENNVGTNEHQQDKEFGVAYDWKFGLSGGYTCGRVPVILKESCPACSPVLPEMDAEKLSLCSGETATISTIMNYADSSKTAQEHDVYWFKGNLEVEDIVALTDLSSAYDSDLKVPFGTAPKDIEVDFDDVGVYTVFVRDANKPQTEDCFTVGTIEIKAFEAPTFSISDGENYCAGAEPQPLVVEITGGQGAYTVSYSINGKDQDDIITAVDSTRARLELPASLTEGQTYRYLVTALADSNGCVAVIDESAETTNIGVYKNPEISYTGPTDPICAGRDGVELSDFISIVDGVDEDGYIEVYSGADGGELASSTLDSTSLNPGSNSFTYIYEDSHTCADTVEFDIEVNVAPSVELTASVDGVQLAVPADDVYHICLDDEVTLNGGATDSDGDLITESNGTHAWSTKVAGNEDALDDNTAYAPTFVVSDVDDAGVYELTYLVTDENTCTAEGTMTIEVHAPDAVEMRDSVLCANEDEFDLIILSENISENSTFDFSEGADITAQNFDPSSESISATTEYKGLIKVETEYKCASEAEFTVTLNPVPNATISATAELCVYEDAINVDVSPAGGDFGDSPGINGTGQFVPSREVIGENKIVYIAEENGCADTATFIIMVNDTTEISISDIGKMCQTDLTYDIASSLNPPLNNNKETSITSPTTSLDGTVVDLTVSGTAIAYNVELNYVYEDDNGCVSHTSNSFEINYTPAVATASAAGINVEEPVTTLSGVDYVEPIVVEGEDDAKFIWKDADGNVLSPTGPSLDVSTLGDAKYIAPGEYEYTVVQTLNGCNSEPTVTSITISECQAPGAEPVALEYCAEGTVPTITAVSLDPADYPTAGVFKTKEIADDERVDTDGEYTPSDSDLKIGENVFWLAVKDEANSCWGAPVAATIYKHALPKPLITNLDDDYCSGSDASDLVFDPNGADVDEAKSSITYNGTVGTKKFTPADFADESGTTDTPVEIIWNVTTVAGCEGSVEGATNVHYVAAPEVRDAIWQIVEDEDPSSTIEIDAEAGAQIDMYRVQGDATATEADVTAPYLPDASYFDKSGSVYSEQKQSFYFDQTITTGSGLSCTSEKAAAVYTLSECNLGLPIIPKDVYSICHDVDPFPTLVAEIGDVYDADLTEIYWVYQGDTIYKGEQLDLATADLGTDILASMDPYEFTVLHKGPSKDAPHNVCLSGTKSITYLDNFVPEISIVGVPDRICHGDSDVEINVTERWGVTKATLDITGEGVSNSSVGVDKFKTAGLPKQTDTYTITAEFTSDAGCTDKKTKDIEVVFVEQPVVETPTHTLFQTPSTEISVEGTDDDATYIWYNMSNPIPANELTKGDYTNAEKSTYQFDAETYAVTGDDNPYTLFVQRNYNYADTLVCTSDLAEAELYVYNCPAIAPDVSDSKDNCSLLESDWGNVEITLNDYVDKFPRIANDYTIHFYTVDDLETPVHSVSSDSPVSVTDLDDAVGGIPDNRPYTFLVKEQAGQEYGSCLSDDPTEFVVQINKPSVPSLSVLRDRVCQGDEGTLSTPNTGVDKAGNTVEWLNVPSSNDKTEWNQSIIFDEENYPAGNTYTFRAVQKDVNGCPSEEATIDVEVLIVPSLEMIVDPFESMTDPLLEYVQCENATNPLQAIHSASVPGTVEWSESKNFVFSYSLASGDEFDPSDLDATNGIDVHRVFVRKSNDGCFSDTLELTVDLISIPATPEVMSYVDMDGEVKENTLLMPAKFCKNEVEEYGVKLRFYDQDLISKINFDENSDNYDVLWYMGLPEIDEEPLAVSGGLKGHAESDIVDAGTYPYFAKLLFETVVNYSDGTQKTVSCVSEPGLGTFTIENAPDVTIEGDSLLCYATDPYTDAVHEEYSRVKYNVKVAIDSVDVPASGFQIEKPRHRADIEFNAIEVDYASKSIYFLPGGVSLDTLFVEVDDPNGCRGKGELEVRVAPRPTPDFSVVYKDYSDINDGKVEVEFTTQYDFDTIPEDPHQDIFEWIYSWDLGREFDELVDHTDHPDYSGEGDYNISDFYDNGKYDVELRAYSDTARFGRTCYTSMIKEIDVKVPTALYMPNALCATEKYEGTMVGLVKAIGTNLSEFKLTIYDAWGNIVWYTDQLEGGRVVEFWDGTDLEGNKMQQGVYTWKIDATFVDGSKWEGVNGDSTFGSIHLLR